MVKYKYTFSISFTDREIFYFEMQYYILKSILPELSVDGVEIDNDTSFQVNYVSSHDIMLLDLWRLFPYALTIQSLATPVLES